MSMNNKRPANNDVAAQISGASPSVGRDEMNMLMFPIGLADKRVPPGLASLKFSDEVTLRGERIRRTWTIVAGNEFPMPTYIDEEVYVALQMLTQVQGFRDQYVRFSRYEMLKLLGWKITGANYRRLDLALKKFLSITIFTNAFWDNGQKIFLKKEFGFHIIDELSAEQMGNSPHVVTCVKWSDTLWKSFQTGYIKRLDYSFVLGLSSPRSKRLYRFLDKLFYKTDFYRAPVAEICHERLGIARTINELGQMRRRLKDALDELVAKRYLKSYKFIGDDVEFVRNAKREPPSTSPDEYDSSGTASAAGGDEGGRGRGSIDADEEDGPFSRAALAAALVERGVARSQAAVLVRDYGDEEIGHGHDVIDFWDWKMHHNRKAVKDPVAFLVYLTQARGETTVPSHVRTRRRLAVVEAPAPLELPFEDEIQDESPKQKRNVDSYLAALNEQSHRDLEILARAYLGIAKDLDTPLSPAEARQVERRIRAYILTRVAPE